MLNGGGRGNASRATGITGVAGGVGVGAGSGGSSGVSGLGSSGGMVVAGTPGAHAELGGGMSTATVGANALNGSAWLSMGGAPVGPVGDPGGGDSGVTGGAGAGGGGGGSVGGGSVGGGNVDGGEAVVGVSRDNMGLAAGGALVQDGEAGQEATDGAQARAQGLGLETTMQQSAADKGALELAPAAVARGGRASAETPTPIPEQAYQGQHQHQHEHHHQQPHRHEAHHYPPDPHHHSQQHDGTVIHHQHHQVDGQREVNAGDAVMFGAADGGLVRGNAQRNFFFS